eukprot:GEZU01017464.1.p1 GENE.GEZU01017464.1~~GEZU01017464.1.p1  ORF type:complete len:318 (+),score=48.91 GEZU01017464.1:60-956(+)
MQQSCSALLAISIALYVSALLIELCLAQSAIPKQPRDHAPSLLDETKNKAYHRAIKKAIAEFPYGRVLELGCGGTALLSMMAARAGAGHVFCCEKDYTAARLARDTIKRNNLADKITVINKDCMNMTTGPNRDMEHRADILIGEMFDPFFIGKKWLKLLKHARQNLIEDEPTIIPKRAHIIIQLHETHFGFGLNSTVEGFDMSRFSKKRSNHGVAYRPERIDINRFPAKSIADEVHIFEFDFYVDIPESQTSTVTVRAREDGVVNGIVLWWKTWLDDRRYFATGKDKYTHWSQVSKLR